MPLPSSINDLSQTAGNNSPAGSESPSLIDDYLRIYASYIALLRDGSQIVGGSRNVSMSVSTASASGTITADEVAVKSAIGGNAALLTNFNKTINLATTGAGAMDTGSAPTSGFVAIYAILNQTTGVSTLLATNATVASQPEIYSGGAMPSGYTASSLLAVMPTTSAGLFDVAELRGRAVFTPGKIVLSVNTVAGSLTALPVAVTTTGPAGAPAIPRNAKICQGYMSEESTATTAKVGGIIAANTNGVGQFAFTGYGSASLQFRVPMASVQSIAYAASAASGTPNTTVVVCGYEF